MQSGVKYLLLIIAAVLVSGGASAQIKLISKERLDSVANPRTAEGAKLQFKGGAVVSFGAISEDAGRWTRSIEWRNGGDNTLVVTRITTSCSCLQATAQRGAVKAGDSSKIELTYFPKGHPGRVEQRVFIYTNLSDTKPSAIITLRGEVTPSADHSADYAHRRGALLLRRDTITLSGDKPQTERIACLNNGSQALRLEADMLSSRGLKLRTEPAVLAAGEEGDLVISYQPESDKKPLWLKLYIKGLELPLRSREITVLIEKNENKN